MAATNSTTNGRRPKTDEPEDPQTILDALNDTGCRAILEATSDETLTATELSERCTIPMSTAYRKVEKLAEAGLLEEQVRINTSGKHATEYRRCFDDVLVSVDAGELELQLTETGVENRTRRASDADSNGEETNETDSSVPYAVADD